MRKLKKEIEQLINNLDGQVGIVIKDLREQRRIVFNLHQPFNAVSIIKLFILADFLRQWQEGRLDIEEQVILDAKDQVGGCGILKLFLPGTQLSWHDLVSLMITVSDNTAANILIERLGIETINQTIHDLHLRRTRINRKLCIYIPGIDNYTTAQDTALLLQNLLTGDFLEPKYRQYAIQLLLQQQLNNKIPDRLLFCPICRTQVEYNTICPQCETDLSRFEAFGIKFAHKTGEVVGLEHDAGILFLPGREVIITSLVGGLKNNEVGIRFQRELGVLIYKYYARMNKWY